MLDITDSVEEYRESIRDVWNTYFYRNIGKSNDDRARDDFLNLSQGLFIDLVLKKINETPNMVMENLAPGSFFKKLYIAIERDTKVPVLINRTAPSSAYWDDPIKKVKGSEVDLSFIGFFDWWPVGYRDFAYYRVRICASSKYPHLVGREALIKPEHAKMFFKQ